MQFNRWSLLEKALIIFKNYLELFKKIDISSSINKTIKQQAL